jgi:hypothetical protein
MRTCITLLLLALPALSQQTTPDAATHPPAQSTTASDETAPSGVEVEIGLGSRIGRDVSNYQLNGGILSQTNIGKATPQLLTGLGFQFCEESAAVSTSRFCSNTLAKRLGVFVSVQFGSGSNQTISGYSVGGTIKLGAHLRFLAGFSEMPIGEIAPGFAKAAAAYAKKNPDLYPGINPDQLALGGAAPRGTFDGIQVTTNQATTGAMPTSVIYYPGSPMETHYRGGFLVGIAMPINIFNLFKGNGK